MGPQRHIRTTSAALLAAAIVLGACSTADVTEEVEPPIVLEQVADAEFLRLTLSASAADRLDIQTSTVESADNQFVVPSAAVIIDPEGAYWVYTSPEPLVFLRQRIVEVREEGQQTFFEVGPAVGTPVAVVGVPELYGAEIGIGK